MRRAGSLFALALLMTTPSTFTLTLVTCPLKRMVFRWLVESWWAFALATVCRSSLMASFTQNLCVVQAVSAITPYVMYF